MHMTAEIKTSLKREYGLSSNAIDFYGQLQLGSWQLGSDQINSLKYHSNDVKNVLFVALECCF